MWQRFTERARKVVFYAQEEAGRTGNNYVAVEHLLLGLIRDDDSIASRTIDKLGVSLGEMRAAIERGLVRGDGRVGQDMQLTPQAKRVIDFAYDEAKRMHNAHIGTEHLLLGIARIDDGLTGQVFAEFGLNLDLLRAEIAGLEDRSDTIQAPAGSRARSTPSVSFHPPIKHLEFGESASIVLLQAEVEAIRAKQAVIRTQDLFFALLSNLDVETSQVLSNLGVDLDKLGREIDQWKANNS